MVLFETETIAIGSDAAIASRSTRPGGRWRAFGAAAAMCLFIAACGGGGGGGDGGSGGGGSNPQGVVAPPSTGATLVSTAAEAQSATPAALSAADTAATRVAELKGIPFFGLGSAFGQSIGGSGTRTIQSVASAPVQALTVETATCFDAGFDFGCTGSVTADYSVGIDDNSGRVTARSGDYIDLSMRSLSGTFDGLRVSLDGRFRMDFLADFAFDPASPSLNGMDVQVTLDSFSGVINGVGTGRTTAVGRFTADNHGTITYTIGGARYGSLTGVSFTNAGTFVIGSGTARIAYWNDSSKYVDFSFQNLRFVNGRPAVGSSVTVTGAVGNITITVTASSSNTVVYVVNMSSGNGNARYTVTETYPPTGQPTYTAVAS